MAYMKMCLFITYSNKF